MFGYDVIQKAGEAYAFCESDARRQYCRAKNDVQCNEMKYANIEFFVRLGILHHYSILNFVVVYSQFCCLITCSRAWIDTSYILQRHEVYIPVFLQYDTWSKRYVLIIQYHICIGKLTIIGLDKSLSAGRRLAINWTIAVILLTKTWWPNFS